MSHVTITTAQQLLQFCEELSAAEIIAFDTEFVSEHSYRSELCLVQVATRDRAALIDAVALRDLTPFWQLLAKPGHETVVHAGREELNFALHAINTRPTNLFDVQIAAGFVGLEYPAGYGSLIAKLLGAAPHKAETRTDWRRRPLSAHQVQYALEDVQYLIPLRDALHERVTALQRLDWVRSEMEAWQAEVEASRTRERWRRVSGMSGLSPRNLALVRELWRWREGEAERRDIPARRVLRDDLLVELARRRTADLKQIRALRGMEDRHLQRDLPQIAAAIDKAIQLGDEDLPYTPRREVPPRITMLGQFLSSALASVCHAEKLAVSLVGTPSDVRDLVAYRLGYGDGAPPILAQGSREEVVGHLIEDLLAGRVAIRIADPNSDVPLAFDRRE